MFVVNVLDGIRNGCLEAKCNLPESVEIEVGVDEYEKGELIVGGSQRLKLTVPFLSNVKCPPTGETEKEVEK